MTDRLEENKRNAMVFYHLMFSESRPREAIERYAGDVYIQHNPHVADGKEAFGGGAPSWRCRRENGLLGGLRQAP